MVKELPVSLKMGPGSKGVCSWGPALLTRGLALPDRGEPQHHSGTSEPRAMLLARGLLSLPEQLVLALPSCPWSSSRAPHPSAAAPRRLQPPVSTHALTT